MDQQTISTLLCAGGCWLAVVIGMVAVIYHLQIKPMNERRKE